MRKYVILNKFGCIIGVADSISDIAVGLGLPFQLVLSRYETGKPIRGKWLVMLREKHEYIWHKHGGAKGGDDYFAFCTNEELAQFKEKEMKKKERRNNGHAKKNNYFW